MSFGLHHFHKIEKNQDKEVGLIDRLVYVGGVLGPLLTLPQLTKIWIDKTASGVSAFSWSTYAIGSVFWILYGITHKEKPIIIINSVWIAIDIFIVAGVFFYG